MQGNDNYHAGFYEGLCIEEQSGYTYFGKTAQQQALLARNTQSRVERQRQGNGSDEVDWYLATMLSLVLPSHRIVSTQRYQELPIYKKL